MTGEPASGVDEGQGEAVGGRGLGQLGFVRDGSVQDTAQGQARAFHALRRFDLREIRPEAVVAGEPEGEAPRLGWRVEGHDEREPHIERRSHEADETTQGAARAAAWVFRFAFAYGGSGFAEFHT